MNHYLFDDILQARDDTELKSAIKKTTEHLGFDTFCYGVAFHPHTPDAEPQYFTIENYPESWVEQYMAEGWVNKDPAVTHCYASTAPLIWCHDIFRTPEYNAIHEEACLAGINGGASLPIHSPWLNGVGCLVVSTPEDADKTISHVQETLGMSQLLACYVNQAVRDLNLLPTDHRFVLQEELTPRELECLRWAIQGLQSKDIARRMKVSAATITAHYLPSIRRKLGVSSTREAVSVAVYHRLVQF